MRRLLLLPFVLWPALASAQIAVLSVAPAALVFEASGTAAPPPQHLSIRNTGSGPLRWTAEPAAPWIRVSPLRGTGPARIAVTIDGARLEAGLHEGRLIVDAGDADDSPVSVIITVEVTAPPAAVPAKPAPAPTRPPAAPAPSPDAAAAPTEPAGPVAAASPVRASAGPLRFARAALPVAARNLPYTQSVPVEGGTPPYTVRLVQGRLPAGLALAGGTITGRARVHGYYPLTLAVTDSAQPPAAITATLPMRVIILLADTVLAVVPPSLALALPSAASGGCARIGITSGRQPLEWSASADVPWLRLAPRSGTSPAGLDLEVPAGTLARGSHAATVTVTMDGAPNSPVRVPITVVVPR